MFECAYTPPLISVSLSLCLQCVPNFLVSRNHKRRVETEENAKVVAAVCGTEFIKFLAALVVLHKDDFEEWDEFFSSNHPGADPILQIILVKNS